MKLLLLISLIAGFAFAKVQKLDEDTVDPKLFELQRGEAVPYKKDTFLPRRVYLVYQKAAKKWVYMVTDSNGRFADPPEFLSPDSVLSGTYLGGLYANERYKVNSSGRWIRTDEPELQNFVVLSTPPRKKWIQFNDPIPLPNEKKK